MKRLLMMAFILCMLSFGANGQNIRGGLSAGLVASQVSGDNSAGFNKLGIFGGPFAHFQLFDRTLFQMEIIYIQKGSRENPSEDNGYYSYKLKLDYVELPLILRYQYSRRLDFEAGLSYSVLVKSYEELYETQISERPFNIHNSSLLLGLYYKINDHWNVNFRSSNSITPIRKHLSGQTYRLNFGQTNNLLSLGLFYTI